MGGDEFCVLAPETDLSGTGQLVTRVEQAVGDVTAEVRGDPLEAADGDRGAVDADALAIGLEVRRGEQAGADARRVQHRGEERRGRALALRSGDQHDPQLPVRLAR